MSVKSIQPLVSIITPCYNAAQTIQETISSVKGQTYTNWELLIVDDGSNDDSIAILKKEAESDKRICYKILNQNVGAAGARNEALEMAKGKYIAFLDSDDLWLPEKLSKQVSFMEEHALPFSFTNYRIIKEDGERTERVVVGPEIIDFEFLLKNTIIGTLTVMLNSELVGPIKMTSVRDCTEDYALWLSILRKGITAVQLNEELAYYRKSSQSDSGNKLKSAKKTWNTYRKTQGLPFIRTLWYFSHYSINAYRKHARI